MAFEKMGDNDRAYFPRNKDTYKLLNGITAVDKAQSQPYVKIWRVKTDGSPVNADKNDASRPANPITLLTVTPPSFGKSVGRYPERPAVSFGKVVVKHNFSLGGPIMYRELTFNFTVHRPEDVFDEANQDYLEWSSIILPGTMYAIRYGWTGTSKNDLMNGNGLADKDNQVEGQKTLLFAVVRYSFSIETDGSIAFTIFGIENSDNILNHITFGDIDTFDFPDPTGSENVSMYASNTSLNIKQYEGPDINGQTGEQSETVLEKAQRQFDKLEHITVPKHGTVVKFQDILDNIFSPLFDKALKSIGYSSAKFYIGLFNDKLGAAKEEFGGDLSGKCIGDFQIPTAVFKKTLGEMRKLGRQLNVYSFFSQIISYICSQTCWTNSVTASEKKMIDQRANGDKKKAALEEAKILADRHHPPELRFRTTSVIKDGKHVIYIYLIDMKREHVKVDFRDRLDPSTTRSSIIEKLDKYNIPLISFKHGLSYIESNQFSVEQDSNVQAILISRAVDPSRYEVAKKTHTAMAMGSIDPRKLIYSSAIKGKVNMLGNFAFETWQMVWLEFGVKRWDGTFYAFEREDTVEPTGFFTSISFRSTGDDPLNTQGVLKANQHNDLERRDQVT